MSDIVIAQAASLDRDRLDKLAAMGAFNVLYFGSSYAHYISLREALPSGWSMAAPGPLLSAAAVRMRDFVINLDAIAWPAKHDRLAWDASRLGERGPLASSLMLNLCRLVALLETTAQAGRYLVVGDDGDQCRLWMRHGRQRGHAMNWLGPTSGLLGTLARAVRSARRRASIVKRVAGRKLLLAWMRRRRSLPVETLRDADVLVTVWGRKDTFPATGLLDHEANYGALPRLLREAGHRVGYLVYPLYTLRFRDVAANALKAGDAVVFIEDLVPWSALVQAILSGLRFPGAVQAASVEGVDISDLLRIEAARDREMAARSEAQLLCSVGPSLARHGIKPDVLLHLYEAQPWEKMLARGVRDHLPATRIVGVQHAPFSANYLSFFPSRRSIADGTIPDTFLTTGEGYANWLREAGVPADRVKVVGAVRYEHAVQADMPRGDAVLCCTGIDLDEAIELASKSALAARVAGRRLIINFHPITDETFRTALRNAVSNALNGASSHVTFSTASMRELLGQADTVLYTTSAACFEAVQAGRRAIYVGRDLQLDYDKLPDEIALRRRSVEELSALLTASDATEQSPAALAHWLAPVVGAPAVQSLLAPPPRMGQKEHERGVT